MTDIVIGQITELRFNPRKEMTLGYVESIRQWLGKGYPADFSTNLDGIFAYVVADSKQDMLRSMRKQIQDVLRWTFDGKAKFKDFEFYCGTYDVCDGLFRLQARSLDLIAYEVADT